MCILGEGTHIEMNICIYRYVPPISGVVSLLDNTRHRE